MQRLAVLAKGDFGGTPANVDHQPALLTGRKDAGHAPVDQPGFFLAWDDGDGKAQQLAAALDELGPVARFAQGLCGHGADLGRGKASQPLAKPCQAGPAALHGLARQCVLGVQAAAQAHHFFEVFHALDALVRADAANFQPKAV